MPTGITRAMAGSDRVAMLRASVYQIEPNFPARRKIACTMDAQGECEGARRACERRIVAPNVSAKQEACMDAEQRYRQQAGCGADAGSPRASPPAGAQELAGQSCGQLW